MDLKDLVLRIKGDSSGAESALGAVQGATSKFGGVVKAVIAGAAVAAVVSFGKSCINAAAESQSAEVLLRSSLGNIKGMTDANKQAAVDWVNAMESSKSFDDAEIGAALQRLTLKTGSLKTAQDMTNVTMEVARNKNISLEAATTLMDGAYNGMTRTLKVFGIEVGPDGKPLKGMEAINAIQEKVKGSGDAWSKTLEGQREQFKTTFGNFQEAVGTVLMPLATEFMDVIQPYLIQAMKYIQTNMPQIKEVIATAIDGISRACKTVQPILNAVISAIQWLTSSGGAATTIANYGGSSDAGIYQAINPKTGNPYLSSSGSGAGYGMRPHAAGGWVGLNGPEAALVGEKGPEYITSNKDLGGSDALLRKFIDRMDTLISITSRAPAMFGAVVNGIGRGQ